MAELKQRTWGRDRGSGAAVYGLGLIGALIYYIGQASGFGSAVVGILKALIWPVLLVEQLLGFLAGR